MAPSRGDAHFAMPDATHATAEIWPSEEFGALIGPSFEMRQLFARLDRVARSNAAVLVQGETGTG